MDRLAHFVTVTALTLAGAVFLGPGGASILAQYPAERALQPFRPVRVLAAFFNRTRHRQLILRAVVGLAVSRIEQVVAGHRAIVAGDSIPCACVGRGRLVPDILFEESHTSA
jgi:hypothetical protein